MNIDQEIKELEATLEKLKQKKAAVPEGRVDENEYYFTTGKEAKEALDKLNAGEVITVGILLNECATVKDIKEMMEELISKGCGDFEVTCNSEYSLLKSGVEIDVKSKTIDLGGFC